MLDSGSTESSMDHLKSLVGYSPGRSGKTVNKRQLLNSAQSNYSLHVFFRCGRERKGDTVPLSLGALGDKSISSSIR